MYNILTHHILQQYSRFNKFHSIYITSVIGTPCSQCMREKAESQNRQFSGMNANNGLASPLGQNGGQEFFGSSEECCSMGSCCNNSCCNNSCGGSCMDSQTPLAKVGNGGGVTEAAVTSEVNVHKRTFHTASLGKLNQHSKDRGKYIYVCISYYAYKFAFKF